MLEKQYEVDIAAVSKKIAVEPAPPWVVRKDRAGLRCSTVLEDFHEFTFGKSTSLNPQFMTPHTEKSHANRMLILLLLKKWYLVSLSGLKFVFLTQMKHQVTMAYG